jgi:hypothetical protein
VLRSQDGGLTWRPTGRNVIGDPFNRPLFPGSPSSDVVGHSQDGYVGCIAVSPFDSRLVAVGIGLPVLSGDSGASWTLFSDSAPPGNLHRHGDTHGLLFDPSDRRTLHVCSDGGLATTPDLGATWQSGANRQLPNLEFYKTSPSPKDSGLVAGSLQDNGNVYAPLYIDTDPWKTLDTGDGVMTQFLPTGDLLRQNNTLTANDATTGLPVDYGRQVRAAAWDDDHRKFTDRSMFPLPPLSYGVIPVDATGAGLSVPANEDGLELTEPVAAPSFKNDDGEPMVSVGANGLQVFGLFVQPDGNSHWEVLGSVIDDGTKRGPTGALLPPDFISAVTSRDGTFIYCGTNNGNVFRLDAPASGLGFNLTVIPTVGSTTILRIVAFAPDGAFLIAGATVLRLTITAGTAAWTTLTGKVLPSGLPALLPPGQQYNALAADPMTNPPTLYVTTAFAIFVSQDNGDSWLPFNEGLPNAPLCTDLRWVQEASGVTFLYVATQGWSVFGRALNVQEGAFSTLLVDGHLDLIDRVLLGAFTGDDTSFVWFNDSRVLGPFHPIDKMNFHGDETMGGEVSADLKLDLLWKVDSSIDVKWNASMSTDEDDESDSASDTVNVTTGSTEAVTVDFKTDDLEPDRVHIEFTATN